jgi:hypothetical protein
MRSLRIDCLYLVCKFWQACVQIVTLSPSISFVRKRLLLSEGLYTQLTAHFTTYVSTAFYSILPQLLSYFYPASTGPTNAITSLFNFKYFSYSRESNT